MADQVPTSRKVPPLAIIVVVILAALAAVAFANWRSTQKTPSGVAGAPQDRPVVSQPIMPQQSSVPNAQQPASDERGAAGHRNTTAEPGGAATTANVTGSSR